MIPLNAVHIVSTAYIILTMVGSMSIYSANPPQTPPNRRWLDNVRIFFSIALSLFVLVYSVIYSQWGA